MEKCISDLFLESVRASDLSDEAKDRAAEDVVQYDKPWLDRLEGFCLILVDKSGSFRSMSPDTYRNDPWSAKHFGGWDVGSHYFMWGGLGEVAYMLGKFAEVSQAYAAEVLYREAKALGFTGIPVIDHAKGHIVSFEELRGSIPEHMRAAFEERVWKENEGGYVQPHVNALREWWQREVETILGYLRMHEVPREFTNEAGDKEWIRVPVTKLSFGFDRFAPCAKDASQTTAFFHVSDQSPDFKPETKLNWHCQDTSRWAYAGALAINWNRSEDGTETIHISSNH